MSNDTFDFAALARRIAARKAERSDTPAAADAPEQTEADIAALTAKVLEEDRAENGAIDAAPEVENTADEDQGDPWADDEDDDHDWSEHDTDAVEAEEFEADQEVEAASEMTVEIDEAGFEAEDADDEIQADSDDDHDWSDQAEDDEVHAADDAPSDLVDSGDVEASEDDADEGGDGIRDEPETVKAMEADDDTTTDDTAMEDDESAMDAMSDDTDDSETFDAVEDQTEEHATPDDAGHGDHDDAELASDDDTDDLDAAFGEADETPDAMDAADDEAAEMDAYAGDDHADDISDDGKEMLSADEGVEGLEASDDAGSDDQDDADEFDFAQDAYDGEDDDVMPADDASFASEDSTGEDGTYSDEASSDDLWDDTDDVVAVDDSAKRAEDPAETAAAIQDANADSDEADGVAETTETFPEGVVGDPDARRPRIALMGEFSSGKSTLSNLLIGARSLPVNVTATHLPPVWISFGDLAPYRVDLDGNKAPVDLNKLEDVPLEETSHIRIFRKADILEICDLIDFPGISDPNMDAEVWQRMLPKADGVIWCTHATQAWRQSEAAVWDTMPVELQKKSILLLTRMDKILSERDKGRVVRRVRHETEGLFRALFGISLTDALAAGDDEEAWRASGADDFAVEMVNIIRQIERELEDPEIKAARAAEKAQANSTSLTERPRARAIDAISEPMPKGDDDLPSDVKIMPSRVRPSTGGRSTRRAERPGRDSTSDIRH